MLILKTRAVIIDKSNVLLETADILPQLMTKIKILLINSTKNNGGTEHT